MVEVEEVQGNVLYAYGTGFRFAYYVLLEFDDGDRMRETLRKWKRRITFGRPKRVRDSDSHVNVAFTYAGLTKLLGSRDDLLHSFPEEFRDGAAKRSQEVVGDVGESHADRWWGEPADPDSRARERHVLLVVHAKEEDDRKRAALLAGLLAGLEKETVSTMPAALLPGGAPDGGASCSSAFHREHFGFADGCSQPAVQSVDDDPVGDGLYARRPQAWWRGLRWLELLTEDLGIRRAPRRWRAVRAGEFLLGYENEDGALPEGPPAPLGPNGTFMVYRELSQDVRSFQEFVAEKARDLAARASVDDRTLPVIEYGPLIRAKIVGRWPDGTPLALSPDSPNGAIATDRRRANNFLYRADRDGYRSDVEGLRCPLGAHVRRTNPRDALPGGAERTMRHRIIRRGMPYGPPYAEDPQAPRGLAFVCFSASIANGFEFIQRQWCNGGAAFGLGRDRDFLLQQSDQDTPLTGMVIPGHDGGTVVLDPPAAPFVTVRGCEYLFLPSRRAYEWLVNPSP